MNLGKLVFFGPFILSDCFMVYAESDNRVSSKTKEEGNRETERKSEIMDCGRKCHKNFKTSRVTTIRPAEGDMKKKKLCGFLC